MKRCRIYIPNECIHEENIETDYDVTSGHAYYETRCRIGRNTYLCSKCPARELPRISVTRKAIAIDARNWLSETTIADYLKPVTAGEGTIETPPKAPETDAIRLLFSADGSVKIDILTNDPLDEQSGLPGDLLRLINESIKKKIDIIEVV